MNVSNLLLNHATQVPVTCKPTEGHKLRVSLKLSKVPKPSMSKDHVGLILLILYIWLRSFGENIFKFCPTRQSKFSS